jgi:GNAT superfamily N-acetyltransferase
MDLLRRAQAAEVGALNQLIGASARELSRGHYTPEQVDSLIRHVFGVDSRLIADGTYYVIERDGRPAACGGWSARRTLFGGDQAKGSSDPRLDPATDAARIRAFFVHPAAARQGLGRRLLAHCESEARAAGFRRAELMATLPGEPLYRAAGYAAVEPVTHTLPDGAVVRFVRMARTLALLLLLALLPAGRAAAQYPAVQGPIVYVVAPGASPAAEAGRILRVCRWTDTTALRDADAVLVVVRSSSGQPLDHNYDLLKWLRDDAAAQLNDSGAQFHVYLFSITRQDLSLHEVSHRSYDAVDSGRFRALGALVIWPYFCGFGY